jgi:hypothetical protein
LDCCAANGGDTPICSSLNGGTPVCAAYCTANAQCESNCCVLLTGENYGDCQPSTACE